VEADDSLAAQDCRFVASLPRTPSGKTVGRVLKEVTLERERGDISTIEDEGSVCGVAGAW
jgi:acetyl-CoA synthetase